MIKLEVLLDIGGPDWPRLEVFRTYDEETRRFWHYWRKRARNQRIVCIGGEAFNRRHEAKRAAHREFPTLNIVDVGESEFE